MLKFLTLFLLFSLTSCGGDEESASGGGNNEFMRPGEDCSQCHSEGGSAKVFTVSGTVFTSSSSSEGADKATVVITDDDGEVTNLTTNSAGNFFSTKAFSFPVRVSVKSSSGGERSMGSAATKSGCNSCHGLTSSSPSRIYL